MVKPRVDFEAPESILKTTLENLCCFTFDLGSILHVIADRNNFLLSAPGIQFSFQVPSVSFWLITVTKNCYSILQGLQSVLFYQLSVQQGKLFCKSRLLVTTAVRCKALNRLHRGESTVTLMYYINAHWMWLPSELCFISMSASCVD